MNLIGLSAFFSILLPFTVSVVFTLIGFFYGRRVGRRQGYSLGWEDARFSFFSEGGDVND